MWLRVALSGFTSLDVGCWMLDVEVSLRIKTAACAKQLTSLDDTIREGNCVVSGRAAHHKPRKGARDAKI